MEIELEPRVKSLPFKVKGMSRESPSQKASHVLDTDLRTHWSAGTNTKEWILLELDEPCLLSHIRIYNKSVLEWEISVGLRYKPETFVKVRPRCEAPRRDMIYPMNYTPCRYVRISCLRGNPIAIFFIQLIGVSVPGLEPEFQPVVNHLLPHIMSHKQDAHDIHLQLLQDMTNRLIVFLPQLEVDLASFTDAAESSLRFLAMLCGPFYPILRVVKERETARSSSNTSDSEASRNSQSTAALTVSSNFEPRRSRGSSPFTLATSGSIAFRPDGILMLLRKAYKDPDLGTVCRMVSRVIQKLIEPIKMQEASSPSNEIQSDLDETMKSEVLNPVSTVDYSNLFGDDFQIPDDLWDNSIINILDVGAVEEGILHVLYACASQPLLCSKLASSTSEFWSALPLVQALLPALRPCISSPTDLVADSFSLWKQPLVQQALSQIVGTTTSSLYQPLLYACAGFLQSFSPSHAKAACVLIDLCSGVLAPWITQVVAKVDLIVELVEDLLGTIQGASRSITRARAALKYIVLALSGHMDDMLGKYKDVKHNILFLLEMLEPFLDPAIYTSKSIIAIGDVSFTFNEKQKQTCLIALNVIRTAVQKSAILPALESEWRLGSVAPSVLLSILEPHMQLPPEIDLCKSSVPKFSEDEFSSKSNNQEVSDVKPDTSEVAMKMDVYEDASFFFAPPELRNIGIINFSSSPSENILESVNRDYTMEQCFVLDNSLTNQDHKGLILDVGFAAEYVNLQADYLQLVNYRDCELRAAEFQRLASDLNSQHEHSIECHDAAIDALLLAAECYVNPFFLTSKARSNVLSQMKPSNAKIFRKEIAGQKKIPGKNNYNMETITDLEKKRDKIVLQLLLEAANLDLEYQKKMSEGELQNTFEEPEGQLINLSLHDMHAADAVTLVRQNQVLLCKFLIQRLQRNQHSMQEILMHCLVFFLQSATKLYCNPEVVINIILGSADFLHKILSSLHGQLKEGNCKLPPEKILEVQRYWMLLQRLVISSTSGDEVLDISVSINRGLRNGNLIPPSVWVQKVSTFSHCASVLVRFLGWMAISRNAKQFIRDRVFLVSDLSQITHLLSIFGDELALVDNVVDRKRQDLRIEKSGTKQTPMDRSYEFFDQQLGDQSFSVVYPDLSRFFPNLKKQFDTFGETILEAVGLQLRSLPPSAVPDILCWFSDLCLWPFVQKDQTIGQNKSYHSKGFVARNAKAVILYVLEAIVIEHMEAMVPEIPRIVQVLVSLCKTSYCDVSFLDSILHVLKPIITYSLNKISEEEKLLADDSCVNFESLCFDELFDNMKKGIDSQDHSGAKVHSIALTIFILGSIFPDLSFGRRREILQSLAAWADFPVCEPTTMFHDYLCAFHRVIGSCRYFLVQTLRVLGFVPLHDSQSLDESTGTYFGYSTESKSKSWFFDCVSDASSFTQLSNKVEGDNVDDVISDKKTLCLSGNEIEDFTRDLEGLIAKLYPTIDRCWNFHHQLARKITMISAQCFMFSRCLCSVAPIIPTDEEDGSSSAFPLKLNDQFEVHWKHGLKGLAETVVMLQENHCWEVASMMLDCLLELPQCFKLDNVIDTICFAIKIFSCTAPKMVWRLQTDKWLSLLFSRSSQSLNSCEIPLLDMFSAMLSHPEPEQRLVSLQHLSKLVAQDLSGGTMTSYSTSWTKLVSPSLVSSVSEPILSSMVSSTWDQVVALASSELSLPLRTRAMALLVDYIPFAERQNLQSLLMAADSVLYGFGELAHPFCEGPLLQLSLALIAGACLYSPAEDLSLIPQSVWKVIETLGSKTEGKVGDLEKKACQVLCKLRNEGDDDREALKEALSSSFSKEVDPDFGPTRDSILQVLANLTSVQSYFELFTNKNDEEAMELEEAEMELDIIQMEHASHESSKDSTKGKQYSTPAALVKDVNRLQQIKDNIRSLERSKLREEIVARRQKKLLMRRARHKYLEEAALKEAELLQELDRERIAEIEKDIERQRLLEVERAKSRELRHNLDMEKERQTQRELQRELEQAESGLRSSRREFPSSGRARDNRYRERENGRPAAEGTTVRTNSSSLQPDGSTTSGHTIVLSGSRSFSGQLPTILQSRDRLDECGSSYDENFEGSRDSGDTGSIGDPESISAFEGSSGYGSGQRHGSRGNKSRQAMERREREGGRREGKWERKHS